MGAYRFDDGTTVSIRPSADNTLRYREYRTGDSLRLYKDGDDRYVSGPGFAVKEPVELIVRFNTDSQGLGNDIVWNLNGNESRASRVGTDRWFTIDSNGAALYACLNLPDGPGPHPVVILIHG
jgi:hypothetical protein